MDKTKVAILVFLAVVCAANVLALSNGDGDGFVTLWVFGFFTVALVAFLRRDTA